MPVSLRSNTQMLVDKQLGKAPRKRGSVILPEPDAIGRCGKSEDKHYHPWSRKDLNILKVMATAGIAYEVIAAALSRSVQAVRVKSSELGVAAGRKRRAG